ncbi:MAG: protein nirF [Oceanospirillaceae bacterium]|nr:protein nirF [Oceanospirillaceae bacterium]MCP5351201.1 protein nirF [Oceanospirillaceae bacterium]
MNSIKQIVLASLLGALAACAQQPAYMATGDLGVVIERADGKVKIANTTDKTFIAEVAGLGDLSHASIVFSRDEKYAYVFGRDGGLSKIDITTHKIAKRILQGGNSIGGAISQDGRYVAVSNYEPGGVKIFDANTLELKFDIPATALGNGKNSKTVGLVDAPDSKFVFSLFDTGEIWVADLSGDQLQLQKFPGIGKQPYDALMSPEGRYYIAGLFGEDGMALLDLWNTDKGVQRILDHYGMGEEKLPVYKMPHLEGWTIAGDKAFVPAVGEHKVLVIDTHTWQQVGSIDMAGQPVFVMARPDHRYIWVNFAHPDNQYIQIIDVQTQKVVKQLEPGKGVLHMEFTPRGEAVWVSVRDSDQVQIYDTRTFEKLKTLEAKSPSGIFFTNRAHKIGL